MLLGGQRPDLRMEVAGPLGAEGNRSGLLASETKSFPKGTAKQKVGTALVRRGARIGGWQHTHGCANTGGGPAQRGDGGGSAAPFERALPPR